MTSAIFGRHTALRSFLAQEARLVEVALRREGLKWDPQFPVTLRETLALGLLKAPASGGRRSSGVHNVVGRILSACRAGRSSKGRRLRRELQAQLFRSRGKREGML